MEELLQRPHTAKGKLHFSHLPLFAKFIRENHLKDYIQDQLNSARELNTPLLKAFDGFTDEQIVEYALPDHEKFLLAAEENRLYAHIEESLSRWRNDKLEIVRREDLRTEDIAQINFICRKALLKYLSLYTTDAFVILETIKEIEAFYLEQDVQTGNVFLEIIHQSAAQEKQREKELRHREEQLQEAQEIAEIGFFDRDIVRGTIEVTPQLLKIVDLDETTDRDGFLHKVHPSDRSKVTEAIERAYETGDYECEYRLLTRANHEKIIWSRGKVLFDNGNPVRFKGTVMDVTEKHHAIRRWQRSEELYKQAQAMAHIGNWSRDLIQNKYTWSEEMYRIYGLEPGIELTREMIVSYNHEQDAARVQEYLREAPKNSEPFEILHRIVLKDGAVKILQSKGEVLTDNGTPYKIIGTSQDVTERQTMMERLQLSEQLYKQAQALAHLGNWTWDIITNKVTWTDELYRIYGYENFDEEITYEKFLSQVHPDDKETLFDHLRNALEKNKPYDFFHRIILKDGTEKILHAQGEVVLDEHGKPFRMMGTGQDVTRQQLAEREIRRNKDFIQKIANTTPSLIASYNINTGKYTFINKALMAILGYDPSEVFEKGIEFFIEIMHPDDLTPLMEKNTSVLEEANSKLPEDGNEMIVDFKYRLRHKNGQYRWFRTYGTIFDRNQEGRVEHLLNVSIDITEQEMAEQEIYEKNLQLQQSNASLEEYAYVASHDLKEPLRKIATFSDRLITTQYEHLSQDGKVYLTKIIDCSHRMQEMISDLLSISVISGNKHYEKGSLKEILNEVLQTLEYKIEEKNAVIEMDDLPDAYVVISQFKQLFQNLIGNSLKFAKEDIRPVIRISHSYLTPSEVREYNLVKADRYLKIVAADNGIGFDNQFAHKIFTIFQRLHSRGDYEGTGIGLAICKKIAENHGGIIMADSVINEGATFSVIIPV